MAKKKKTTNKTVNKKVVKSTKTPKTSKKEAISPNTSDINQNISEQLRLGESYISLILGGVVVVVIFVLILFVFLKGNDGAREAENLKVTPSASPSATSDFKIYIMKEDESLWDIAVREFGDGFRYVEIIEANNFENPDYVPHGTEVKIPLKK